MKDNLLKINNEIYIISISCVFMFFSFLCFYTPLINFISFILMILRSSVFLIVPLFIYVYEMDKKIKGIAGIFFGYFCLNLIITLITSVSYVKDNVPIIFAGIFNLMNLIILLTCILIIIEQIMIINKKENKFYINVVMKAIYFIGDYISSPFTKIINKKSGK